MNSVVLMGRLVREPQSWFTQSVEPVCVTRYTLAVPRRFHREGEQEADFVSCITFGKSASFASKYFTKGIKIAVSGRIQTGSYTNKDGVKVYTTDVVVESQEFAESKSASQEGGTPTEYHLPGELPVDKDGFMNIPDDIDEELPFN